MKTLSKSFSASTNRIPVTVEGRHYEIANLLKSGTLNQTTILIGDGEKWNQVKATDLGINYVNLTFVAEIFEKQKFTLAQVGFETSVKNAFPERDLNADVSRLHETFPAYSIDDITELHNHITKYDRRSCYEDLKVFLRMLSDREETVQDYIVRSELETQKLLNNKNMEFTKLRENRLKSLGMEYNATEDSYGGFGFTVTGNQIETLSVEEWETMVENIQGEGTEYEAPSPEVVAHVERKLPVSFEPIDLSNVPTPNNEADVSVMGAASKSVSITVVEGLEPSKVKEFKDLEKETAKLLKANPVITITDKASLEKAKQHRHVILKSCTAIDGKDGLAAITGKAFTTAKKAFDNFLNKAVEPRRNHYDKLDAAVKEFENAETIRLQAEQAAKIEKMNQRRDMLYSVPMTFNGTMYSVGTVYIFPSQIETCGDEEFNVLVDMAKNAVQVENDKDAEIRLLKEKLAALSGETVESPAAVNVPDVEIPEPTPPAPVSSGPITTNSGLIRYQYPVVYVPGTPQNDILNKLDGEHLESISKNPIPGGFITARGYFIRGMKDTAQAIDNILRAPAKEGVLKSQLIADLCKTILTQP